MKNLTGKKVLLICFTIVVLISSGLLLLIIYRNTSFDRRKIGLSEDSCHTIADTVIYGSWETPKGAGDSEEEDFSIFLDIYLSNTFRLKTQEHTLDKEHISYGYWSFDNKSNEMSLKFKNVDEVWSDWFSSYQIANYYPGIVEINSEQKSVVLKIKYLEDSYFKECQEERYYINLDNNYLYKRSIEKERLITEEACNYHRLLENSLWVNSEYEVQFLLGEIFKIYSVTQIDNIPLLTEVGSGSWKIENNNSILVNIETLNPRNLERYPEENLLTINGISASDSFRVDTKDVLNDCSISKKSITIFDNKFSN